MATMNDGDHGHPKSTAKIGGHPIHPMLVPFPIVCFILVFLCDIRISQGPTVTGVCLSSEQKCGGSVRCRRSIKLQE